MGTAEIFYTPVGRLVQCFDAWQRLSWVRTAMWSDLGCVGAGTHSSVSAGTVVGALYFQGTVVSAALSRAVFSSNKRILLLFPGKRAELLWFVLKHGELIHR